MAIVSRSTSLIAEMPSRILTDMKSVKDAIFNRMDQAIDSSVKTNVKAKPLALDSLTETTNTIVEKLNQTTENVLNHVNVEASHAIDQITSTTEIAKASLEQTVRQAEQLATAAGDEVERALANLVQNWLDSHPLFHWAIDHPIWAIAIIIFSPVLLLNLFSVILQIARQAGLSLVKAPFELVGQIAKTLLAQMPVKFNQPVAQENSDERLNEILLKLEILRQEQNEFLEEVKMILEREHNMRSDGSHLHKQ
jgi:hypothetical protein